MFYVNCLWYVLDSIELEWFGVEKIGFPICFTWLLIWIHIHIITIYTIYPIGPKHALITGVVITVTEDVFAAAGLPIVWMVLYHMLSGGKYMKYWMVVNLPLWKKYKFVSWDDEIPQYMESHKIHVPNHQSRYVANLFTCQSNPEIWAKQFVRSTANVNGFPGDKTLQFQRDT